MKTGAFFSDLGASLKSIVKIAAVSRRCGGMPEAKPGSRLIVMGNGPSLSAVIENDMDVLTGNTTMAVNFAANAPVFNTIRPRFYILADPLFFNGGDHENVRNLWQALSSVDWGMTFSFPQSIEIKRPV